MSCQEPHREEFPNNTKHCYHHVSGQGLPRISGFSSFSPHGEGQTHSLFSIVSISSFSALFQGRTFLSLENSPHVYPESFMLQRKFLSPPPFCGVTGENPAAVPPSESFRRSMPDQRICSSLARSQPLCQAVHPAESCRIFNAQGHEL